MNKLWLLLLMVILFVFTFGCSQPQPQQPQGPKRDSARLTNFDFDAVQSDLLTGKLRFEVRGLKNESEDDEDGPTFMHRAVVVALGDSKYTKLPFSLWFSVKRLSDGDPQYPRKTPDYAQVSVRDGVGKFFVYGGTRPKGEKWELERIEVRPHAVFVGIPLQGEAVAEQ